MPSSLIVASFANTLISIKRCSSASQCLGSFENSPLCPSAKKWSTTVILFCVKVPVLSVQIMLVEPSVSTAGSLRMIACCLAIFFVPNERTIVTIDCSASGIAATATATANIKALTISCVISAEPSKKTRSN